MFQFVDRELVGFAEHDGSVVLECEHIAVARFECGDQRRVAIEVHRVLVGRPGLPVHSDCAAALREVAGFSPLQGFLRRVDALGRRCRVQDELSEAHHFLAHGLRVAVEHSRNFRVIDLGHVDLAADGKWWILRAVGRAPVQSCDCSVMTCQLMPYLSVHAPK